MISIGPYHHGKEKLKKMEKYKLKYLQGILKRRGEERADRCIDELRKVEKEARDCYAEDLSFSRDDFVEMMLLDGCFIIEFLRKHKRIVDTSEDDHLFSMGWYNLDLCSDLLLFENQLPVFILELLFDMTKIENHHDDLISLSISCLKQCFKAEASYAINQPKNKAFHLLRLMHESWFSSFSKPTDTQDVSVTFQILCAVAPPKKQNRWTRDRPTWIQHGPTDMNFVKSACELVEYGIKFEKAKEKESEGPNRSLLNITFEDGIIQIPTLAVEDTTECILRNLIAYEQYSSSLITGSSRNVVTDYVTFIDCLINSPKDAQVLCDKKIITNWLGSDEELSNMINKTRNVSFNSKEFTYRKVFKDVNEHCSKQRHRWITDLKKKYFHNPWAIISFLAAILLLLLTLVQTIYAVL